jgi:hypothetical protein
MDLHPATVRLASGLHAPHHFTLPSCAALSGNIDLRVDQSLSGRISISKSENELRKYGRFPIWVSVRYDLF